MIKVLFVEDDSGLRFIVKSELEKVIGGYEVTLAPDGKKGLDTFASVHPDVVVTDVDMPVMDGNTMAAMIRKKNPDIPIIILSGLTESDDFKKGYASGIDTYLKKPFTKEQLDGQIKSLLRRTNREKSIYLFKLGHYTFDKSRNILVLNAAGREVKLTPKEAEVLEVLCRHKGSIVERNTIMNQIWGADDYFTSRSLDNHILKLRKLLEEDTAVNIQTYKRTGLMLTD
ncbi:MAG TPA: response regulator transcription factor [Candidatus Egerieousia sp.]|nr:response regulator transcription factor [Candidatus Egerieousia sp.]HPT05097.1 response regulator transcription factor [Candidatus Egerieousia sp.]